MAIDESLLGGVRPNESAVDRLRKRNRIRPWESGLVGAQPKQANESVESSTSPPGQSAQGASQPEGDSTGGSLSSRADHPLGNSPTIVTRNSNPVGSPPTVSPTQGVTRPVGQKETQAQIQSRNVQSPKPIGSNALGVASPGGDSPSGSSPVGEKPTGQDTHSAPNPVDSSPAPSSTSEDRELTRTQRVGDPGGDAPTGQSTGKQDAAPLNGFDPTPFVPADKGAILWREKGSGELRIPHRIYEYAHRVTSTRNELLVFDCLLRFSLGFHRSWCEAGYSFIAAWTGISDITNIKKSLKTLLGAGVVVKTKEHDSASNSGSVYEVPVVKGYLEYVAQKKAGLVQSASSGNPLGNLPSGQANQSGETPGGGGRHTSGAVGDLPPKKENSNQNSKKTPSQQASGELDAYVDQVKPASKRESEIFFLGKLLPEYSTQDVALALNYVRKFGVLGSKEECHSPLKYLSSAIEQVLPKAREYRAFLERAGDPTKKAEEAQRQKESESAEEQFRITALSAFETQASQEEQDRYLADVTRENSVMGYAPPIGVLRGMAALKWFEEKQAGKV